MTEKTLAQVLEPEDEELETATPDGDEDEFEDIDPMSWLSAPYENAEGYHYFKNGKKMKITAITDEEESQIRKRAMRPDPKNPKAKKLDFLAYRREMIAASVNKGRGFQAHSPGAMNGEMLKHRPVGEINAIAKSVMQLSGVDVDEKDDDTAEVFG